MGHDVVTAQEAGMAQQGIPDSQQLDFAAKLGRAVLTFDRRDFLMIHRRRPNHQGIIICTVDENTAPFAARIDAAIRTNEPLAGRLIRVNKPS